MTEFHIKRVDGGWQINGDGDVYPSPAAAQLAVWDHTDAENISEYQITWDDK